MTRVGEALASAERRSERRSGPSCVWEGSFFLKHSLAIVNRQVCRRLLDRGIDLSLLPYEVDEYRPKGPDRRLLGRLHRPLPGAADVHVRHCWPPKFDPPPEGRWVMMQHWEYGSLPRSWIAPMRDRLDEVWVATSWVRDCFISSGVPAERVVVVPLGVDPEIFRPGLAPLDLPTKKHFRFLFVGGTVPRKGVHRLLEAWVKAFRADDDVSLVIKDMGTKTFYRGSTAEALIAKYQAMPGAPEILYLDRAYEDADLARLYASCQSFVAPYRGEGFGLPIAEAMACGLAPIVTGYGAAMDFCNAANAYLIPAREVRQATNKVSNIETVDLPWVAEPDIDELVRLMRRVVNDRAEAVAKGELASREIRERFTWDRTADIVAARLEALSRASSPRPIRPAPPADAGVLWSGPVFNGSGYARVSRVLLPALANRGASVRLQHVSSDTKFVAGVESRPSEAALWRRLIERPPGVDCNYVFLTPAAPDGEGIFSKVKSLNADARAHVGMTMFETDRLPRPWVDECNRMDEVWVPSAFNVETFAGAGVDRHRLRRVPFGIDHERWAAPGRRHEFASPAGFVFLSVFQWSLRKGWDVLLEAWVRTFARTDDVMLVLRCDPGVTRSTRVTDRVEAYLRSRGIDPVKAPWIEVIEDEIDDDRMPALFAAADAFVLPSRGEGWGMPYMEAMAAGLPTIGTRWSGQLEFMNDDNAFLIDVDGLVRVPAGQTRECPLYESDHMWAEPNVDHLSRLMRAVFENRRAARERGARAARDVAASWTADRMAAGFMEQHETLLGRRRDAGRPAPPSADAAWTIEWHAPLRDSCGYADEARGFVFGLDDIGASVATRELKWSERRAGLDAEQAAVLDRLAAVRPTGDVVAVQHTFPSHFAPRSGAVLQIGRTMFESDRIPPSWVAPCNAMDEVWVPSRFNVETFSRSGVLPAKLHVIPGSIDGRRYQRLPEPLVVAERRGFNFLSIFDWTLRKGWDLLLRAYVEEFAAGEDVALWLHVHSSLGYDEQRIASHVTGLVERCLGRKLSQTPDIVLMTRPLAANLMPALYRAADAFVMPSRGEGWGRPYMEAMACAVPTIGTRWSGNLEFMTDDNSWLIDAAVSPVAPVPAKEAPVFAGHRWAAPDVAHLRRLMREVFTDRQAATRRAERGRADVLERFERRVVARMVKERVAILLERAAVTVSASTSDSAGSTWRQ